MKGKKNTISQALSLTAETFRLKRYYYIIEISTLAAIFVSWFFVNFFPSYFFWIRYPKLAIWNFVCIFALNSFFFALYYFFGKKIFFNITRYSFIVFFFVVIYATGGVASSFVFMLLFPILVSTVDLDAEMTKMTGIIVGIVFALLIFTDPSYLYNREILVRHFFNVAFFFLMAFYSYRIVKETLVQKFEKEEATKKLFEIVEIDKLKTDFVTVASHQLRTPLSSASWGLDNVLSDQTLSENSKKVIKESYQRIQKANEIVSEMLQAVDIGQNGYKLNITKVDVSTVVREILNELHYLVVSNGIELNLNMTGNIVVEADRNLLRAAVTNVLDNAIRYSPRQKVNVSLFDKGDSISLSVKDTGLGIEKDDMPYIFEKFFRGKNALATDPNESGVGLYVTKKIIGLHGGTISLDSEIGKGTFVEIILPVNHSVRLLK